MASPGDLAAPGAAGRLRSARSVSPATVKHASENLFRHTCPGIPDNYEFLGSALINILKQKVPQLLA